MATKTFRALGTKITLTILNEALADAVFARTVSMIKAYEDRLTVNRDVSEVMTINHHAGQSPVVVSAETFGLIEKAVMVSQLDFGFNVAIGPLVKLWRIGFDGANRPTAAAIQERLALIQPENILLDASRRTVFLTKAGMALDLGGIAKGFIADQVKAMWCEMGVTSGVIDLGGNILLVGQSQHADGRWRVGIQDPNGQRHNAIGHLKLPEKSIGTSGIYERKLVIDGQAYHHMFDSKTGFPIQNNLASVTIVSNQSIDGEIWSTIAFYQGLSVGKHLIEQLPNIEAVFVTKDLQVTVTSGLTSVYEGNLRHENDII